MSQPWIHLIAALTFIALQLLGMHILNSNRSSDSSIYPLLFFFQGMYFINIATSIFAGKRTYERTIVRIIFGVDRI